MKLKYIKHLLLVLLLSFEGYSQVPANYELVWSDDFNGTQLDAAKWSPCPAWNRQGGSYWEADNMSLNGSGKLTLEVSERNDSVFCGAIRTHKLFDQKYGYFEVRCKVPQIQGGWAAFWLMPYQNKAGSEGNDGTEVDVFESINGWNNKVNHAIHWDGYAADHQKASQSATRADIYDNNFHKFAMLWTPTEYVFYIDDQESWRTSAGGVSDVAQYLKLTLEVSGDTWPGDWNNQTMKPIDWIIDYVKVYEEKAATQTYSCDLKNWSHGTVIKSPDAEHYNVGTSVQLTAIPSAGFEFTKWYGTQEDSSAVVNLSMDKNYEQIPEFLRTGEMVNNSQFLNGITSWSGSGASMTVDTGSHFVPVVSATPNTWDIQILQGGLIFESGTTYQVAVEASSSQNRTIVVALGMNNSPWTSFGSKTLSLTTTPQTFTFNITVNTNESNGRVAMNLGKYGGDVTVSEVSLVKTLITSDELPKDASSVPIFHDNDFQVWPNPSESILFWDVTKCTNSVIVLNLSGRVLASADGSQGCIDISHLPAGVYLLSSGLATIKIVKN
jgi:beta-glucanase (GH16 family)